MRRRTKSFLEAIAILFTFLVLVSFISNPREPELGEIPDFYEISREISLDEFTDYTSRYNMSIYLPSELPNNLELTVIYVKYRPFIAIVVYSAEGNKDYKTAELTIEIVPSSSPPTYNELISQAENSEYISALEINDWLLLVNEKSSAGGNVETREKYGEYILVVIVWIEGMRYIIFCPTLITNQAIQMVGSMQLLTL